MVEQRAPLDRLRAAYAPRVPEVLRRAIDSIAVHEGPATAAVGDVEQIRTRFPSTFGRFEVRLEAGRGTPCARALRLGVVFSGGQAPGGHNVVAGLFDGMQAVHPDSELVGFLGGPKGIFTARHRLLAAEEVDRYRNTGGFDMIGSGRDKIESAEQLEASRKTCGQLQLDGLVVVGGDDSNTNAAVLAEFFADHDSRCAVVGVPKTIDGDLKNDRIETSFGFDTATKLYAGLIGNICRDAKSAGKYWHFIKLMGRSASHVTLECALQTHPNVAVVGEEIREKRMTLGQVVDRIAAVVRDRARAGRNYGVCLVPEGLIEFIPEVGALIGELNAMLSEHPAEFERLESVAAKEAFCRERLAPESVTVFADLPGKIREQLLLDRDAHGNVQVSKIDTETLLQHEVAERVEAWRKAGEFPGAFSVQNHFFGYEGRCAAPSNFDANYTYALGRLAALLAALGQSGAMCALSDLAQPPERWGARGVPLTSMMQMELRKGRPTPVIAKALVRTDGPVFRAFAASRERWGIEDDYRYPAGIQYFGPSAVADAPAKTLLLERTGSESVPGWLLESPS